MRDGAQRLERALDAALPAVDTVPAHLHEAMRYATLDGGKRVRPLLVYAANEACGARDDVADAAAVAVELIHAYSLVHDDMPEMDNDALRRGRPTVHVAYGQATALLVGDALQSLAFEVLAHVDHPNALAMVRALAGAAGSRGMVGGQAIDLDAVGVALDLDALERMHRMKTGALLSAAVRLGVLAADRPTTHPQAFDAYAAAVGLAFQVVDDILDTESDTATLGKTAGKDAAADKPTYVSRLGLDEAKRYARALHTRAHAALDGLGPDASRLREIADFVVARSH